MTMKLQMIMAFSGFLAFALVLSCSNGGDGNDTVERGADTSGDSSARTADSVTWHIDNLESIGGHAVTVEGAPRIVDAPGGKGLFFDGVDDGVFLDVHPLEGSTAFTLEVVFRPDADGPEAQRFFHLQEDGGDNRILVETRVTPEGWYLDTFILSGETDQTLVEPMNLHPCGEWYNATLVFDGREMRHYVNGTLELSAVLPSFTPPQAGRTSIGVRINRVYWFKGTISRARFTRHALEPSEFMQL